MKNEGTATLFSAAQTFDEHGRVTQITLDDGAHWDYGYDAMGQITSGVKKDSGNTALPGYTFGYGFDTIGNRETATRESMTEAYTPNRLNQINSIDHGGLLHLLGTADPSANVAVDGATTTRSGDLFYGTVSGNNTFESFSILGTLTGAGDAGSDAVARFDHESYIPAGPTSRTHDESGNLTEDAEWTYTWDAENRLVQTETRPSVVTAGAPHRRLTFEYDSQSRRTKKTVEHWDSATSSFIIHTSTLFLWNNWLLSTELEADTLEPIRSYTWGHDLAGTREQTGGVGGLALVKHYKNGEITVPLYTINGNVCGYWEIDAAESVAEFEYGPFGELLKATGEKTDKHPIHWSSKYEDEETGLVYYGYRFFDPETGRWLNRDPISERGDINVYSFARNRSLSHVDFLGLWTIERASDQAWAKVTAEDGDTIAALAREIGLSEDEAKNWLKTIDGQPQDLSKAVKDGCESKIPNTIVLFIAKRSSFWDYLGGAFNISRSFARSTASGFEDTGYKVIRHESVSGLELFKDGWKTDGIAGFLMAGHGFQPANFVAAPDSENNSIVSPSDVKPPYNLAIVGAWFCWSANNSIPALPEKPGEPFVRYWRQHASPNGLFIGYTKETRITDIIFDPDTWEIENGR